MVPRRTWQRRCQGRGIERPQENSRVIHHCKDLDRKSLTHLSSFGSACCRTPWNNFHLMLLHKLTFTLRRFSFRSWGLPGPFCLRRALVKAVSTTAPIAAHMLAERPSQEEPKMQPTFHYVLLFNFETLFSTLYRVFKKSIRRKSEWTGGGLFLKF